MAMLDANEYFDLGFMHKMQFQNIDFRERIWLARKKKGVL